LTYALETQGLAAPFEIRIEALDGDEVMRKNRRIITVRGEFDDLEQTYQPWMESLQFDLEEYGARRWWNVSLWRHNRQLAAYQKDLAEWGTHVRQWRDGDGGYLTGRQLLDRMGQMRTRGNELAEAIKPVIGDCAVGIR